MLGLVAVIFLAHAALRLRTSDELYQIPPAEMASTIAKANGGDVAAAERLQDHFLLSEGDRGAALRWMRRAADLGSSNSRDLLVEELWRGANDSERQEAARLAAQWGRPLPRSSVD